MVKQDRNWHGLRLEPLDTLFFRDGKPFEASNRVVSGLPTPQTLAGAVRTTLLSRSGFSFSNFRLTQGEPLEDQLIAAGADPAIVYGEFRGPFLAIAYDDGTCEPLFPQPVTLVRAKKGESQVWSTAIPADPGNVPGWKDLDALHPLKRAVVPDAKAPRGYMTLAGLKAFLNGVSPDLGTCYEAERLHDRDYRVGIELNADSLTTIKGQIYSVGHLVLKQLAAGAVCFYAEFRAGDSAGADDLPKLLEQSPISFGGEGRSVRVSLTTSPQQWPTADSDVKSSMWYLATPTFLPRSENSARPLPQAGQKLVAAASDSGMAVSGWDNLRNGPRETRFAVPAGAVYFIDGAGDSSQFLDSSLVDYQNLQREGWGFALPGIWKGQQT
jgi:CRISPR-associated protein Cmr3